MGYFITSEILNKILENIDIVEVISEFIPLKKTGKNYRALCPFHSEKTPSFTVNPDKQIFKCFGCGIGGDVIKFLMEYEHLSYPEAVKLLAQRVGINLDTTTPQKSQSDINKLYEAYKLATGFYVNQLESEEGKKAYKYLIDRGIVEKYIKKFALGYSPSKGDEFVKYAIEKGFTPSILIKAGLVEESTLNKDKVYDRFRGRVMFPITNIKNLVVGFGARILNEGEPKYLNSPQTPIFNKSRLLYGLSLAKKYIANEGYCIVMEGYTDVIMAHQAGIKNTVATLGTSMTSEHARILKRFTDKIILIYDADIAGQKASERSIDILLPEDLDIKIVILPQDYDPCEFILKEGKEKFLEYILQAKDIDEFKIEYIKNKYNLENLHQRREAVVEIVNTLSNVKDKIKRDILIRKFSERLNISEQVIREKLSTPKKQMPIISINEKKLPIAEKRLLELLINYPEYTTFAMEISKESFLDKNLAELFELIKNRRDENILVKIREKNLEEIYFQLMDNPEIVNMSQETREALLEETILYFKKRQIQKKLSRLVEEIKKAEAMNEKEKIKKLYKDYSVTIREEKRLCPR